MILHGWSLLEWKVKQLMLRYLIFVTVIKLLGMKLMDISQKQRRRIYLLLNSSGHRLLD